MPAELVASQDEAFVLQDGRRLYTIQELYHALETLSEKKFSQFVNETKNDFAAWIEHSLDDRFLAATIRRARTKKKLQKMLFITLFR